MNICVAQNWTFQQILPLIQGFDHRESCDTLLKVTVVSMCVGAGVQYRVEPREIKARLDSPVVMGVMATGYPRDLIRQAIERRLTTTGSFCSVFPASFTFSLSL